MYNDERRRVRTRKTRAPQTISLKEILDIIRMAEKNKYFNAENLPSEEKVKQLITDIDAATEQVLKERTLRNLVLDKIH